MAGRALLAGYPRIQDCINSSALAMELLQSCTKPLIHELIWGLSYCTALFQALACCLYRYQPLPGPVITYDHLNLTENQNCKCSHNANIFHLEIYISKMIVVSFVQGPKVFHDCCLCLVSDLLNNSGHILVTHRVAKLNYVFRLLTHYPCMSQYWISD